MNLELFQQNLHMGSQVLKNIAILNLGAVILFTLKSFAAGQLEDGNTFHTVKIVGKVHVECSYESGNGWADQDCAQEILLPTYASRFKFLGKSEAKKLILIAQHEDLSATTVESFFDSKTGLSDSDFNLWANSGRYDQPLLKNGKNSLHFKLILKTGQIESEGKFEVQVDNKSTDHFKCRSGRMSSDNSRDCSNPPPRYLCSQYFRYENYCGAH